MSTQYSLKNFEEIYNLTYEKTLKYIICKCSNIDDVNDLIQSTYVELYSILKRKKYIDIDNIYAFMIGVSKKKLKKYYGLFYKPNNNYIDIEEVNVPSNIDVEANIILKLDAQKVWDYIKNKDFRITKIFYLYYCLQLKISEISVELEISESNVKNLLYRTIKEIRTMYDVSNL